ncbi:TonB-dependent siderophore receptor [Halomonas elongata]|uniref:TonB-dependent receptor n=1 Tax=Halomonas elongata (strain ATCC 33173 / DSM 2581 / NBRC 15536 / NCIMB 2198 / 1H9) TaxID=768066 RepID=E1V621_HALED|nr:TonB-dependent siderophore receptor [Halomonas elongata]WBF16948.1 TonB-dependent siderophore receptor [Halomonas elongata]WPU45779.1 TonB-dependent siderophore receptor [Halomonas elongata DSM 2581]CBV43191.1 TonB-dependent receptor [Halomonas elongata DSM 2581]
MFRPTPLALAIALATSGTTLIAQAQQAEQLDTVTVTGTAATKTETPFNETPQATSRVEREDWEEKGAETVQRALNYTAGVYANQVGASNRYDYIVMRGFSDGSLSNTFLDGLKLMGDANSYSSLVIDPYFLDNLEVVKGPASVLYGRASPGGLVSMTSKRPEFEDSGEIRVGVGNNAQRSAAFDLTGPLDDERRLAFRLTGKASAADTQFGPVEEKRYAIAPQLTWDITDATSLTLHAYLQKDPEGGYHSGVPYEGAVKSRNGRKIDNNFFDGEDDYDKFERTQRLIGYDLEHRFNDDWTARQKLLYLNTDVHMDQVAQLGWIDETNELSRAYYGAEESLQAWTLDNQVEANLNSGFIDHTVLLGVDYQKRKNDVVHSTTGASSINPFDPQYSGSLTGDASVYADERHELSQTGVYIQDQMAIGNWRLSLGGRYDWVDIENTDKDSGATSNLDDTQFSGRAGLLYAFDNGVSPYISYSTAFTPTSFVDENGDLLKPMEGQQLEAGVKYQPNGTQDRYSLALFHIDQENVATKEQPADPYEAIGEIESQGVELEAHTQLTDNLRLQASYSFTDITYAKSDDGNEGNRAIYAPRHQASVWGHYRFHGGTLAGLGAGLGVRYRADIQADRANTETVPDYTLVDAALSYDFANVGLKGVTGRINVNNLLDKEYVASCNSLQYCYFGAERSVKATVSYAF